MPSKETDFIHIKSYWKFEIPVLKQAGFSLLELMVAIIILAIISAVGLVSYSSIQLTARDAKRKNDLKALQTALELFKQQSTSKTYPFNTVGCLSDTTVGCNSKTNYDNTTKTWIPTLTAPEYINTVPIDPINDTTNNYKYIPTTNGSSYLLCTKLENTADKDLPENKDPVETNSCTNGYLPAIPL